MKNTNFRALAVPVCVLAVAMATFAADPPAGNARRSGEGRRALAQGSLKKGDLAPEFTLRKAEDDKTIALKDLRGKPTVLVFGSCTCPPFVRSLASVNELAKRYSGRVNFVLVYIREAHPTDGRAIPNNQFVTASPKTIEERCTLAKDLDGRIGVDFPIVVDSIDDAVHKLYSPWPNRLYILDSDGRIVDAGEAGAQGTTASAKAAPKHLDALLAPARKDTADTATDGKQPD